MTPILVDPVEVLFTAQLGGGTDINRAVAYAQEHFIERPERTLFLLVTDLFEGGDRERAGRAHAPARRRAGKAMCLLALSDGGKPSYDHELARSSSARSGSPASAARRGCSSGVVERVMKGQDLAPLLATEAR